MHWIRGAVLLFVGLAVSALAVVAHQPTQAQVSSCSVSVSPTRLNKNTAAALTFTVTNSDSVDIVWTKFTAASEQFEITSASASGWSASVGSPTEVTFTGGTLSAGNDGTFTVNLQTSSEEPDGDWAVQTSDAAGGTNPFTCSGDPAVTISNDPEISNISVTNITTSAATVTWTTDVNTDSRVDYGTTASYGSNVTDSSLVISHSINLTSLSAGTTYHYQVTSADASSNSSQSSDNTFTTASASSGEEESSSTEGSSETTITTSSSTEITLTPTPTPTATAAPTPAPVAPAPTPIPEPVDTTRPSVFLVTDISQPQSQAPELTGSAADASGIVRVDYSIDGGANWQRVDAVSVFGSAATSFTFRPRLLSDGNYPIRLRAFDAKGNVGVSALYTLVIDQLPPQVGLALYAHGPQLLTPNQAGAISTIVGLDHRVVLSAVGGPTSIDLTANEQTYSLVQHQATGLWSGAVSFAQPGTHRVIAHARDGANNQITRSLNSIVVHEPGLVSDAAGQPLPGATLMIYYRDPVTNAFVEWNAKPFGLLNPQTTDSNGQYRLMLPPGEYYLQVEAARHRLLRSDIFSLATSQPITTNLPLEPKKFLSFAQSTITITPPPAPQAAPEADSPQLPGATVTTLNNAAPAPALITFMTSWAPPTAEQLAGLDLLTEQVGKRLNVAGVLVQDSAVQTQLLAARGGYVTPLHSDPIGQLAQELGFASQPTHVLTNHRGEVHKVVVGVLDLDELLALVGEIIQP